MLYGYVNRAHLEIDLFTTEHICSLPTGALGALSDVQIFQWALIGLEPLVIYQSSQME